MQFIGQTYIAIPVREDPNGQAIYLKAKRNTAAHFGWDRMPCQNRPSPPPQQGKPTYTATKVIRKIECGGAIQGLIWTCPMVLRFPPGTRWSFRMSGAWTNRDLAYLALHTQQEWAYMRTTHGNPRPKDWWMEAALAYQLL